MSVKNKTDFQHRSFYDNILNETRFEKGIQIEMKSCFRQKFSIRSYIIKQNGTAVVWIDPLHLAYCRTILEVSSQIFRLRSVLRMRYRSLPIRISMLIYCLSGFIFVLMSTRICQFCCLFLVAFFFLLQVLLWSFR